MGLKVIGAGFGRTGTLSVKHALEMLGFGPCYHMIELMHHPEYIPHWHAAADGEIADWDVIFSGYHATVDWPAAYFWRELTVHYPEANVLLTVRDSERWYESFYTTIYSALTSKAPDNDPLAAQKVLNRRIILENTFAGRFEERPYAIGVYEQHNEEVQRSIPANRLLVYEVTEGWEPLCHFLACPVPQEPFPKTNSSEEFHTRRAAQQAAAGGSEQA